MNAGQLLFLRVLALLLPIITKAQELHHPAPQCARCMQELNAQPKEVQFGLNADVEGTIWFVCTDEAFFKRLIGQAVDGIAVDVVPRSLYACDRNAENMNPYAKGTILPTVQRKELLAGVRTNAHGTVFTRVGQLPAGSKPGQFELNILLYNASTLCRYTAFYDLPSARWDLLNMGMYMDTHVLDERTSTERQKHSGPLLARRLTFTIPFPRNSAVVDMAEIRPMLDSLRSSTQRIVHVEVMAFSSVEGPSERNLELQEGRARAIAEAIPPLLDGATHNTIALENWLEFLRDVQLTEYAHLTHSDRESIKRALRDRRTLNALEHVLASHRKVHVTIDLRPRSELDPVSSSLLIEHFDRAVLQNNHVRAREIQQQVMARITDNALPSSFIDRLEVPAQRDWASLLNARHAFKHFNRPEDAYTTYLALLELDRMMPDDAHIRYNLCAVKFRLWLLDKQTVVPESFKKEIADLYRLGIPDPLVERMLLNHALVMAEVHMNNREWTLKDKRLDYVSRNYRRQDLSMPDRISMARYFASFGNVPEARGMLEPYVEDPLVATDALFYYLNLTIFDREHTRQDNYRRILVNAGQRDKRRFCEMFQAYGHGGIMFQLLEDPQLKHAWCDICR